MNVKLDENYGTSGGKVQWNLNSRQETSQGCPFFPEIPFVTGNFRKFKTKIFMKKKALLIKFKHAVLIDSLLTSDVCQKKEGTRPWPASFIADRVVTFQAVMFLYCLFSRARILF